MQLGNGHEIVMVLHHPLFNRKSARKFICFFMLWLRCWADADGRSQRHIGRFVEQPQYLRRESARSSYFTKTDSFVILPQVWVAAGKCLIHDEFILNPVNCSLTPDAAEDLRKASLCDFSNASDFSGDMGTCVPKYGVSNYSAGNESNALNPQAMYLSYLYDVDFIGATGRVTLDQDGNRAAMTFDVLNFQFIQAGLTLV